MRTKPVHQLTMAAMLCAIGIVIPMVSPFRIILEPASYTLGSHIAIFIAMFISPSMAVVVSMGTTIGFFFGGFPIVIVIRAASHVVFAFCGGMYIKHRKQGADFTSIKGQIFSFSVGIIHSVCEVLVVIPFYFGGLLNDTYKEKGFLFSVILLVGVGTVIHSMVDFSISQMLWHAIGAHRQSPLPHEN